MRTVLPNPGLTTKQMEDYNRTNTSPAQNKDYGVVPAPGSDTHSALAEHISEEELHPALKSPYPGLFTASRQMHTCMAVVITILTVASIMFALGVKSIMST